MEAGVAETRAHVLAHHWYCAEQGRLQFNGVKAERTASMSRGSRVHEWLEERPRRPSEAELLDKLEGCRPHSRVHDGVRVFVHPDDFTVDGRVVTLEEYKSIDSGKGLEFFERYRLPCGEFQLRVYQWVMEPILNGLGYGLNPIGYVRLVDATGRPLRDYTVRINHEGFLRDLSMILGVYRGESPPVRPSPLKCRVCKPPFRDLCTVAGVAR